MCPNCYELQQSVEGTAAFARVNILIFIVDDAGEAGRAAGYQELCKQYLGDTVKLSWACWADEQIKTMTTLPQAFDLLLVDSHTFRVAELTIREFLESKEGCFLAVETLDAPSGTSPAFITVFEPHGKPERLRMLVALAESVRRRKGAQNEEN
jgi:hypothetical protein